MKKIQHIIQISDVHIRTYKLHDEYREVFNGLFIQLRELLKDYSREEVRIVIAGDLVHQKITISNELLVFGTWFLRELEKIAPLVIIAGNHDLLENNKDRMDSITPMVSALEGADISYFKESKCYVDNNVVWCVYSIFEENRRPDIELARIEHGNDKKYVGLFHGAIIGAKTDLGYSIEHGTGLEIFEGCDAVMLGDIHKRQTFTHNGIPIKYSSSTIQQDYSESIKGHGFLMWNVEDLSSTFYEVENKYKLYKMKIKSIDDLENNKEIITNLD